MEKISHLIIMIITNCTSNTTITCSLKQVQALINSEKKFKTEENCEILL